MSRHYPQKARILRGRDRDLDVLRAAYGELVTQAMPTRFVLVTGEAGIGKTALVEAAADEFAAMGALVLGGSCPRPHGLPTAYTPFIAAWSAANPSAASPGTGPHNAGQSPGGRPRGTRSVGQSPGHGGFSELLREAGRFDSDPPEVAQAWLCGRLLEQLTAWGLRRPVVLLIDDAHWIDPASLSLLHTLVTTRARLRLLVVVTARADGRQGATPELVELATRCGARSIELEPLPDDDIRDLITAIEPDRADLPDLVRRAAGHPLFAAGLARHRGPGLPTSLAVLLRQRVRELGEEGLEFLAAVALAGDAAYEDFLAGTGQADPSAQIQKGMELGLLTRDSPVSPVRPCHPLFAEAAQAELAPATRLDLHRRFARNFTEAGAMSKAAWHWEQSGDRRRALDCWHLGGIDASGRHAYAEAADAHLRALDLHDALRPKPTTPDHTTLTLAAATALRLSGRSGHAASLLRRALATVPAGDLESRCEVLCRLWDCRFLAGNRAEAEETLAEATSLAAGLPDSPLTARLAAAEGGRLIALGRYEEGARRCREAVEHAARTRDDATRACALSMLGVCLAFTGAAAEAVDVLETARTLAHRIGSVRELVRAAGNLTFVLANSGRHERCVTVGRQALSRLDDLGLAGALGGPLRFNVAVSLVALGRWRELGEAEREPDDRLPPAKQARILLCLAEVAALRGEHDAATGLLDSASAVLDGPDALFEAERAIPAAVVARVAGRHRGAVELCRQVLLSPPDGLGPIERWRLAAEGLGALADLHLARGRFNRFTDPEAVAAQLLAAAGEAQSDPENGGPGHARPQDRAGGDERSGARSGASPRPGTPEEVALWLVCRAEAARLWQGSGAAHSKAAEGAGQRLSPGEFRHHAARIWGEAAEAWDGLRIPYHRAHALMREAEVLVAQGDPGSAAEPLRQALTTARELGTMPLIRSVERVARQGRIPLPGLPATHAATAEAPEARHLALLTRREREVLDLVGRGRTNREIAAALVLSERTVGVHVSRILAKLGASNRAEAARLAVADPVAR